ncbi:MAG: response regulator [Hyphomonadaceae bacterium]
MPTVLIAEDDEAGRHLLARRLMQRGYDVILAADGADAVTLAVNERPDIIIMDLSMPIMDGVEAWRTIREMSSSPPPVIALTGALIEDVRITCVELGFAAYIVKPYDYYDVLKCVDGILNAKAA